MGLKLVAQSAA